MKIIIIFAAALLLGCSAMSAQNKGDMSVGGIFGFSAGASKTNITSNSTTVKGDNVPSAASFQLNGNFGFFFADNWKLGASLGYTFTSEPTSKKDDKWLKNRANIVLIGPSISYYVRITDRFFYTPGVGVYCAVGNYKTDLTSSISHKNSCAGFAMNLELGSFEFKPTSHWGIAVGLVNVSFADVKVEEDSDNYSWTTSTDFSFGIKPSVGINFYF